MWILNFLPDWFFYFLTVAGVLGLLAAAVFKFLPIVSTYRLPIQVVSVIFLLVGVYYQGAISNEEKWQAKIKDLEAKVAVAEEKSKAVNTVIKYQYIDRIKVVKDIQVVVEEKIKEIATIIDKACEVPPEAVKILNDAAKNPSAKEEKEDKDVKEAKDTLNSAAKSPKQDVKK